MKNFDFSVFEIVIVVLAIIGAIATLYVTYKGIMLLWMKVSAIPSQIVAWSKNRQLERDLATLERLRALGMVAPAIMNVREEVAPSVPSNETEETAPAMPTPEQKEEVREEVARDEEKVAPVIPMHTPSKKSEGAKLTLSTEEKTARKKAYDTAWRKAKAAGKTPEECKAAGKAASAEVIASFSVKCEVAPSDKEETPAPVKEETPAPAPSSPEEKVDKTLPSSSRADIINTLYGKVSDELDKTHASGVTFKAQFKEWALDYVYRTTDAEGNKKVFLACTSGDKKHTFDASDKFISAKTLNDVLEGIIKGSAGTPDKDAPVEKKVTKAEVVQQILAKMKSKKSVSISGVTYTKGIFKADVIKVKKIYVNKKASDKDVDLVFLNNSTGETIEYPICGTANMNAEIALQVLNAM